MMCQSSGRPPICTIGFGRYSVSSRNRVPIPPAKITTFISCTLKPSNPRDELAAAPSRINTMTKRHVGAAELQGSQARRPSVILLGVGILIISLLGERKRVEPIGRGRINFGCVLQHRDRLVELPVLQIEL